MEGAWIPGLLHGAEQIWFVAEWKRNSTVLCRWDLGLFIRAENLSWLGEYKEDGIDMLEHN